MTSANQSGIDLNKVLTPEFLDTYRRVNIPYPEDQALDFNAVTKQYFMGEPDLSASLYQAAFPTLKIISSLGVENIPDLTQFLPPPDAPNFPAQALGLALLFDQAPRGALRGTNKRYVNSYFDEPSKKLSRKLFALPKEQRPDSMARMTAQGWSYDYAMAARIWFIAPLAHSEEIADQEHKEEIAEEWRKEIEEHVGSMDPHRKTAEEDAQDVLAFARLAQEPPAHEGTTLQEYMFYVFRLLRVHTPIICKFGRYPYRNGVMGRESSEEEERWAQDTNYMGFEKDEDVVRKIKQDVDAGVWSPLHDQPEFEKH